MEKAGLKIYKNGEKGTVFTVRQPGEEKNTVKREE